MRYEHPLMTDKEVEVLQREMDEKADVLTAVALMWLWSNPDPTWRVENRSGL